MIHEPSTPETNNQPKHLRPWERRVTLGGVLIILALVLVLVVTGYPFFYIFFLAVMPYDAFVRQSVHLLPAGFTLEYFGQILSDSRLVAAFGVSIVKTVLGTALSVVVTTLAGYALSRPQLRGRKFLTFLFLVPLFVSGGLIPFFLVIRALGLLNTFWALVLPGLVSSFNFFIVRAYFQDYPQEVIEAATVDGASPFAVFWRIVWPTPPRLSPRSPCSTGLATGTITSGPAFWCSPSFILLKSSCNRWSKTATPWRKWRQRVRKVLRSRLSRLWPRS